MIFHGVTVHSLGWCTCCKYQTYRRTASGALVVSVRMVSHWSRKPTVPSQMKWDDGSCWGEAAWGGWWWWQCHSSTGLGARDSLHHQWPPFCLPLGIDSLMAFPSWTSQHSGDPGDTSQLGTNLLSTGWSCASCVSCTGHNSKLHVSRSQLQAPQAQGCFCKSYLAHGECPLDLFGQPFFPACHQNCPVDTRLEITCFVIQPQHFGVGLNCKKLFYWHHFTKYSSYFGKVILLGGLRREQNCERWQSQNVCSS